MSTAARKRARLVVVPAALLVVLAVSAPLRASTLATLELSAERGMPGQELSFSGWYYNDIHPVMIRWDTIDGPVLATVTPDTFSPIHNHFRSIAGTLRIPPDAQPGPHLLVATQDFAPPGKITWGVPVRTRIHVGQTAERTDVPTPRRPSTVATSTTPGVGQLLVTATAGAVFAGLLVGAMVVLRRRGPPS